MNTITPGTYVQLGRGKAVWEVLRVWPDGTATILSNNGCTRIVPQADLTVCPWSTYKCKEV